MSSLAIGGDPVASSRDESRYAWFLRGVVATSPAGPVVQVRGQKYPLPTHTQYPPGAELQLKLLFQSEGWQLQIVGLAGAQNRPLGANPLAELVARLDLPMAAEAAQRLLPAHLPATKEAVSTLIQRLAAAEGSGPALGQVVRLVTEAVMAGVAGAEAHAQTVAGWLLGAHANAADWRARLQRARGPTPEAVLHGLLFGDPIDRPEAPESQLSRSPEHALAALAGDASLASFARRIGRGDRWQRSVGELAARLDGERLLGLHALATPYRFVDLPMEPESGWRRAQVHLLNGPGDAATAVVDVHTEHLGDVWMQLTVRPASGRLRVAAAEEATRRQLTADADTLKTMLAAAGHPGVEVVVEPWDGDRLAAAVGLFETPARVEVEA